MLAKKKQADKISTRRKKRRLRFSARDVSFLFKLYQPTNSPDVPDSLSRICRFTPASLYSIVLASSIKHIPSPLCRKLGRKEREREGREKQEQPATSATTRVVGADKMPCIPPRESKCLSPPTGAERSPAGVRRGSDDADELRELLRLKVWADESKKRDTHTHSHPRSWRRTNNLLSTSHTCRRSRTAKPLPVPPKARLPRLRRPTSRKRRYACHP